MQNVVGKPVQGEDFFGRDQEVRELQALSRKEHVLLLAPRRVGKTSLLHALGEQVKRSGDATPVYASVAVAKTEAGLVDAILRAAYATREGREFRPSAPARWMKGFRRVKRLDVAGSGVELEAGVYDWQTDADRAIARLSAAERPWLFMIDELPTVVIQLAREDPSGRRVRALLQWFRDVRQRLGSVDKLRFILAGSIGLDSVTQRYQLTDTINDLRDWRLGPYDEDTARRFLATLAASYKVNLTPELIDAICEHAEWLIPYHLQVIFSSLCEQAGSRPPSMEILRQAVEQLSSRAVYFSSWVERLRVSFAPDEEAIAREMLALACREPQGAPASAMLTAPGSDPAARSRTARWIVGILANDGYLVEHAGRWRFRSGLLRRYWERQVA
jgi:hypothetical protein